jgi:hypothetical protein
MAAVCFLLGMGLTTIFMGNLYQGIPPSYVIRPQALGCGFLFAIESEEWV